MRDKPDFDEEAFEAEFDGETISFPLSCEKINTSIISLGKIVTNMAYRKNYWSNRQCLFRHPYPGFAMLI